MRFVKRIAYKIEECYTLTNVKNMQYSIQHRDERSQHKNKR